MIITTARKPSSKTRIFCKHLSRFTGWEYVTRGKTSFNFFSNGKCVLSIRANVSLDKEIEPGEAPVIEGDTPLALAFSKAAGLKMGKNSGRVIHVNDRIEFIDDGVPYIILKVLAVGGEGIV